MTQPVQLSAEQFDQLLARAGQNNVGNNAGNSGVNVDKSVKPVRPSVDIDTSEGEWAYFKDKWSQYKRMAKLTAIDGIRDNLRQCCAHQLDKRLFDTKGGDTLNAATEENLLIWIKEIAVKGVHKEVHRTQFVHTRQKQGESYNSYYSTLKSASSFCDFRVYAPSTCSTGDDCTCPNHGMAVSYQDDMVATQLIAGLYNSDHKSKVLSESANLTTLEAKFERLIVLEQSGTSMSTLEGSDTFANVTSVGCSGEGRKSNRQRRQAWKKKDEKKQVGDKCPECHKKHDQCKVCNGFHKCTTKCNQCKVLGHIRNCCPTLAPLAAMGAAMGAVVPEEEEEVAFAFVTTVTMASADVPCNSLLVHAHQISKYLLSHMEFKGTLFEFSKPAKPPLLRVTCTILVANHAIYGRRLERKTKGVKASGLADTGAQVCTAGPNLLSNFDVDQSFLVPTRLEVKGITHFPVTMLGAIFLEVSANGMRTRQIVYIASEARSLILSETALKALGVLPPDFPAAGTFAGVSADTVAEVSSVPSHLVTPTMQEEAQVAVRSLTKNSCGCPLRTEVPPTLREIPIQKPETNRALLRKWILEYYKSSAFNVCPHQLIPAMTGPDMHIVTEDGAEPVAHHSPVPVPFNMKRRVKEIIDQNCNLGVFEPVPVGVPTTWLSRMLSVPKKSGEPRLVVDLQGLNAVSKRATHHTPSPWNLVCMIPKGMKKSILDASNGYHLIPLAPESREKNNIYHRVGEISLLACTPRMDWQR